MEVVMRCPLVVLAILAAASVSVHAQESKYYELPKGDYPHDVAVGPSGDVWYAGQSRGIAGRLNPVLPENHIRA
jgi:virginiamycin B lyase